MPSAYFRNFVFIILLNIPQFSLSQSHRNFSIGFNPLSIAEPHLSFGPAIAYRFSERISIWTEASYLIKNSYLPNDWNDLKGVRLLLQPRYYYGKNRRFFLAPELRFKKMNFINTAYFHHVTIPDSSGKFQYKESHTIRGIALILGKDVGFSGAPFILQITAGLGLKHRSINRNSPSEFYYKEERPSDVAIAPKYEQHNTTSINVPIGVRLMWRL